MRVCAALESISKFLACDSSVISSLPFKVTEITEAGELPPTFSEIQLPEFASQYGTDGFLLVPSHFCDSETIQKNDWKQIPWLNVACWFMHGLAERSYESQFKTIHSYSFHLKDWDTRMWKRAWVNRIALFLRAWVIKEGLYSEEKLPLPTPKVQLTFDVDAVKKTWPIRIKGGAFACFNTLKNLKAANWTNVRNFAKKAFRFFFLNCRYDFLQEITDQLEKLNLQACFHVYALPKKNRLFLWLMDPGYKLSEIDPSWYIHKNNIVGVHTSFDSWNQSNQLKMQREHLEAHISEPVQECRQHWLRFSWEDTWSCQKEAGFSMDTTLGFNDRPSFRNGTAFKVVPMSKDNQSSRSFNILPMVLMDSHIYDYENHSPQKRLEEIDYWLEEIVQTRGQATVLWHPHTLSDDFQWRDGLQHLMKRIKEIDESVFDRN